MTHDLEDLSHKKEAQPSQKRSVWVLGIYGYILYTPPQRFLDILDDEIEMILFCWPWWNASWPWWFSVHLGMYNPLSICKLQVMTSESLWLHESILVPDGHPLFNGCFSWMIPKSLFKKWLFHQTSIKKCLFRVPGYNEHHFNIFGVHPLFFC